MAQAWIKDGTLVIRFTSWERVFTLRQQLDIPLSAIRDIGAVPPMSGARGIRKHGITVLGLLQAGHWGFGSGLQQIVALRRGTPAVRVRVDPAAGLAFDEILVSLPDADGLVATATRGQESNR